jgi:glycerol-3-phosphate acyltransferase PlsY
VGGDVSDMLIAILVIVGAYFSGSIPSGLLLARARGIDIRDVGSGNIGATNVARSLGKKLGAVVLLIDALKGAIPTLVVLLLDLDTTVDPFVLTATGFAAICGHCFPVWLGFRGGKGVATSLGVFLVADPLVAGIGVATFVVLYALFRIASIGSMAGAVMFPVLLWILGRSDAVVTLGIAGAAVVIFKHRGNLVRLFTGTENKV